MQLSETENRVLKALAELEADDGEYVSLERLRRVLGDGEAAPQLGAALPLLERARFVEVDGQRRAKLTEGGIAALHSIA